MVKGTSTMIFIINPSGELCKIYFYPNADFVVMYGHEKPTDTYSSSFLILGRSPFPDGVIIVGRCCSTPCTEVKDTLDSVHIWLKLSTLYSLPLSELGSLPFFSSVTSLSHIRPPPPPLPSYPLPPPDQCLPAPTTASTFTPLVSSSSYHIGPEAIT